MDRLVGVWRLLTFEVEDVETGRRQEAFGPQPSGIVMFHPEGRMAAIITPSHQPGSTTEAEQAGVPQKLIAYSGAYRIEPPDVFVTSVDVAWLAPWVGTDQARHYHLDGDRLEITSPPGRPPGGGAMMRGVLALIREKP